MQFRGSPDGGPHLFMAFSLATFERPLRVKRVVQTRTAAMGRTTIPLDRALQIAAELKDDVLLARLRAGS
jgi:hypothetical protein